MLSMKKLVVILILSISMIGCSGNKTSQSNTEDSVTVSEPVIEKMCKEFSKDKLTPEEIAKWDSMNADGGYLLIRGAERNLDTVVNHIRLIFITEP
jgi:hypothetical protein